MTTTKITPSEPTGILPIDDNHPVRGEPLMDRDCVLLDGACKCLRPYEDCKYISKEKK